MVFCFLGWLHLRGGVLVMVFGWCSGVFSRWWSFSGSVLRVVFLRCSDGVFAVVFSDLVFWCFFGCGTVFWSRCFSGCPVFEFLCCMTSSCSVVALPPSVCFSLVLFPSTSIKPFGSIRLSLYPLCIRLDILTCLSSQLSPQTCSWYHIVVTCILLPLLVVQPRFPIIIDQPAMAIASSSRLSNSYALWRATIRSFCPPRRQKREAQHGYHEILINPGEPSCKPVYSGE